MIDGFRKSPDSQLKTVKRRTKGVSACIAAWIALVIGTGCEGSGATASVPPPPPPPASPPPPSPVVVSGGGWNRAASVTTLSLNHSGQIFFIKADGANHCTVSEAIYKGTNPSIIDDSISGGTTCDSPRTLTLGNVRSTDPSGFDVKLVLTQTNTAHGSTSVTDTLVVHQVAPSPHKGLWDWSPKSGCVGTEIHYVFTSSEPIFLASNGTGPTYAANWYIGSYLIDGVGLYPDSRYSAHIYGTSVGGPLAHTYIDTLTFTNSGTPPTMQHITALALDGGGVDTAFVTMNDHSTDPVACPASGATTNLRNKPGESDQTSKKGSVTRTWSKTPTQ